SPRQRYRSSLPSPTPVTLSLLASRRTAAPVPDPRSPIPGPRSLLSNLHQRFDPPQVFFGVDAGHRGADLEHADRNAVVEGAQLLERFGQFEGAGWQRGELELGFELVAVEA